MKVLLVALGGSIIIPFVRSWGSEGHRLITTLADELVSEGTARFLRNKIGEDIETASVWADTDAAETAYPKSNFYHFSSTPYRNCAPFDMNRDCGFGQSKGFCIVSGLADAISRAIDINVSDQVRSDALKFVLHLMADIHQPLHTGFREDTGGVRIFLKSPPRSDLHYIWDSWMIEEMGRRGTGGVLGQLRERLAHNRRGFGNAIKRELNVTDILSSKGKILKFAARLASETSTAVTCNYGYTNPDGSWISPNATIGKPFFDAREPTVIVQLLRATVRLGLLLDGIADEYYRSRDARRDELAAERIERLFSVQEVPEPVEVAEISLGSRFDVLWLADPLESRSSLGAPGGAAVGSKTDSSAKKPKKTKRGKSGSTRDDTALIDSLIDKVVAERESYTFMGIDLSEVVLSNIRGVNLVTTNERSVLLKRPKSEFPGCADIGIYFGGGDGEVKLRNLAFDKSVFGERLDDNDFLIRVILKISNVDPRIDITDYKEIIRPTKPKRFEIAPIFLHLVQAHYSRSTKDSTATRDVLRVRNLENISRHASKIISKRVNASTLVFVHLDTVLNETWVHRRFGTFRAPHIDRSNKALGCVFFDPVLLENPVASMTEEIVAVTAAANANNDLRAAYIDHPFWSEINEASTVLTLRLRGEDEDVTELRHIEWFTQYPIDPESGSRMTEWFRRSRFESEQEVERFLGIDRELMMAAIDLLKRKKAETVAV